MNTSPCLAHAYMTGGIFVQNADLQSEFIANYERQRKSASLLPRRPATSQGPQPLLTRMVRGAAFRLNALQSEKWHSVSLCLQEMDLKCARQAELQRCVPA